MSTRALPLLLSAAALSFAGPARAAGADEDALWAQLRGDGLVVLLRHARAPGTYDPPGFRLGDCSTQRNLSDEGRAQARRLGEVVRARGMKVGEVRSSRWCRASETAALAFGGYAPWPELDSLVNGSRRDLPERAERIRKTIAAWRGPGTLVLVSHQWVIEEVTGHSPEEGVLLVVRPTSAGRPAVLGTLRPE